MPSPDRLLAVLAALAASLVLAACGGASPSGQAGAGAGASSRPASTAAASVAAAQAPESAVADIRLPHGASANQTVASVGSSKISAAEVAHWMAVKSPLVPLPDPPRYSACIANLRASPAQTGTTGAKQSEAELRHICVGRYEEQLKAALSAAIHNRWLIGEGAEEGIEINEGEVLEELAKTKRSLGGEAKFKAYLKGSDQTLAELKSELRIDQLASGIFANISKKDHAASAAEVSRYYEEHKRLYAVPQGRDVRIVRTATEAPALRAKRELQSGKSFAEVAKGLSAITQPLGSKNGEVKDLQPHIFEEKVLNDAIFSAPLKRLTGPLRLTALHRTIAPETNSGFFVFEVRRVVPGREIALSEVRGQIARQLTQQHKQQNLANFIRAFKRKWTARTDCRAGYAIVRYCRQFKQTKASEAEDAYEL